MFLSSISLRNIRKHTDTKIDFANKLNYIVGGNGVGKTTILESIYYLCTTKSCVTTTDSEVVKIGKNNFTIQGCFAGMTNDDVQINYSHSENKKVYLLNSKQVARFSNIIGKFPVVLLSPADHSITQGYPAERRRFVDSVISQASRTYLNLIIEYNRTLKQRAYLLNRIRENNNKNINELNAWTERLVSAGVEIIKHRIEFVGEFEEYINDSYKKILSNKEEPRVQYYFLDGKCQTDLENCFIELLAQREEDEIRRGTNLVGPHRDDFIFDINGISLKSYGSQGQHKTFQTVLRFAEFFYLKDRAGNAPLFLLDDVFGELDADRAIAISNYLSTVGQAFITLTDFGYTSFLKLGVGDKVIKISEGSNITYA
ncbi:MAG: DNA replication and repair protein RecF [Ignavibacteriaceae bacterium]|jgi:DNA replication and repair protein RecF|nr:DNA replication and repair protein RecF [Ignavibacteriaceae bacterium]